MGIIENVAIAIPLKCLNNIWIFIGMSLINYKVELKINWTKHCVLVCWW